MMWMLVLWRPQFDYCHPYGTNAHTHTSICVCARVQWNPSSTKVKGLYEAAVTVRSGASTSASYRADIATLQGRGSVLTIRKKHGRGMLFTHHAPAGAELSVKALVYPGRAHRNNLQVPVLSHLPSAATISPSQRLASLWLSTFHSRARTGQPHTASLVSFGKTGPLLRRRPRQTGL